MPSKQCQAILVWKQIVNRKLLITFIKCSYMHGTLAHENAVLCILYGVYRWVVAKEIEQAQAEAQKRFPGKKVTLSQVSIICTLQNHHLSWHGTCLVQQSHSVQGVTCALLWHVWNKLLICCFAVPCGLVRGCLDCFSFKKP